MGTGMPKPLLLMHITTFLHAGSEHDWDDEEAALRLQLEAGMGSPLQGVRPT